MAARRTLLLTLILLLVGVAVVLAVPALRWRAQVLVLVASGKVPNLPMADLLAFIGPDSDQPTITRILTSHNAYAVIHVPTAAMAHRETGGALFRAQCATCHAPDGRGSPEAPSLVGREFKHGDSDWAIYRTIREGVPNTPMPPHSLSRDQLWQLVAYVRSLDVPGAAAQGLENRDAKLAHLMVPASELAALREPEGDWLTFSGSYSSNRHSSLDQINRDNVRELALRWILQLAGDDKIECSPLERDDVLFVTVPRGQVLALDASTGRTLWRYRHEYATQPNTEGPGNHSRGLALLGDKVFYGAWDSTVIALSARTGKVVWEKNVGRYPRTYINGAPLAYGDLVVTGVGTIKDGGRGFIVALDANTGKERWRFMAIPGSGEPGNDTWAGDSWREGGAGTWMTGSYDPQSDLLYWGVGNPKPDFNTDRRRGDNLYTDSVVALRGSTGERVWSFQFTPGDDHDWDSNQMPLISDRQGPAGLEKRLLWANRNGFYYVLERGSGRFLRAEPYVRQNWAERIDSSGRPVRVASSSHDLQGRLSYPGAEGGTNWWPPSVDPEQDLVFVPVLEQSMVFFPSTRTVPFEAGRSFYTAVRALDASTGKLVWEHRQDLRLEDNHTSGLLSTRGGLLFGGDHGEFFALDTKSGRQLWSANTGGSIDAAPITYLAGQEQFVTVAAGRTFLTFALPRATP